MSARAFPLAIDPSMRRWSRLFLIHPETCALIVDDERAVVVFGRWRLAVQLANIADVAVTGPYTWWKVAGPPRISFADRGATFATTAAAGICLELFEPVPAINPLPLLRHPGLTVTVADPERVAEFLRARIAERVELSSEVAFDAELTRPVSSERRRAWPYLRGTRWASGRALWRWWRRDRSTVVQLRREVTTTPAPPPLPACASPNVQAFESGVGPAFHRRYIVDVATPLSAVEAMALIRQDLNAVTDPRFAPVNKLAGEIGSTTVGDRLVVALAGPWSGPVEVVGVDEQSVRLATLAGHLEAGQIEFRVESLRAGELRFTIESWARNGDQAIRVLFDLLGVGQQLQAEMWVEACETFVALVDGRQLGPVQVVTDRCGQR